MIKPVLLADSSLVFANKKERQKEKKLLIDEIKNISAIVHKNINAKNLLEYYESIMKINESALTLMAEFSAISESNVRDKKAINKLSKISKILKKLEKFERIFTCKVRRFNLQKLTEILNSNDALKATKLFYLNEVRGDVSKELSLKDEKEEMKIIKAILSYAKSVEILNNKPIKNFFNYQGQQLTPRECFVKLKDPKTTKKARREMLAYICSDQRETKDQIEYEVIEGKRAIVAKARLNEVVSFKRMIAKSRKEKAGFLRNSMNTAIEINKRFNSLYISARNEVLIDKYNISKIDVSDRFLPLENYDPIPFRSVVKFYTKDILELFPKEGKYILDNLQIEGTFAILESETKPNGVALTIPIVKKQIYYIIQSYMEKDPMSAFILSHELGHSMHNKVVAESSDSLVNKAPPVIAEGIADTFAILYALKQIDNNTKYKYSICQTLIRRFDDCTSYFAAMTNAELDITMEIWDKQSISYERARSYIYDNLVGANHDEKPRLFGEYNYELEKSKISAEILVGLNKFGDLGNYTISFMLGLYFANEISQGRTENFIKLMKLGGDYSNVTESLAKVGIDIESSSFKSACLRVIRKVGRVLV